MFKIGDWVQITPTPDLRWDQWYKSRDIYQHYLDKIGVIKHIVEDDERPGKFLYSVKVKFPDGLENLGPGEYYEWFRSDHLILSSQSLANLRFNMAEAGKELQEWESFKKKSTDDMLRKIFTPEEKEAQKEQEKKSDDPNQWDLKTPADDYDAYYDDGFYPDYNSYKPVYQYDNSTNIDYSYYSDISDAKTKDQD
jgi:hypothetical protein